MQQKDISDGEPSDPQIASHSVGTIQSTTAMGELAALQSQNSDSNEQLQELIRQNDTLTLNR